MAADYCGFELQWRIKAFLIKTPRKLTHNHQMHIRQLLRLYILVEKAEDVIVSLMDNSSSMDSMDGSRGGVLVREQHQNVGGRYRGTEFAAESYARPPQSQQQWG